MYVHYIIIMTQSRNVFAHSEYIFGDRDSKQNRQVYTYVITENIYFHLTKILENLNLTHASRLLSDDFLQI